MTPWIRRLEMLPGRVWNTIIPNPCVVCGRSLVSGERFMCLHCLTELPRVTTTGDGRTLLDERVASLTVPVGQVLTMFYYRPLSPYSRLIRLTKYRRMPAMGRYLARMYGDELVAKGVLRDIDMIVPVPMNVWKQLGRGYNQAAEIARGVGEATGLPVRNILRAEGRESQTRMGLQGRRANAAGRYRVRSASALRPYSHILLVDDVLTTGATVMSCVRTIHSVDPTVKVSVLTLGLTVS